MATIPLNQIKGHTMTKTYFDLLEELDSKLSDIIDRLEDERDIQEDYEDEEVAQDMLDSLEAIRGVIND